MNFAREEYSEKLVEELAPLWKAHFEALAHFKDIPLDPDLEVYRKVSNAGYLRIYTARENMGLVGYNIFIVREHAHYKKSISANQDIIFLDERMRKGFSGYRFMKWCDGELKKENVQTVYQHTRLSRSFSPLLERMGYMLMDQIYVRRLDTDDNNFVEGI